MQVFVRFCVPLWVGAALLGSSSLWAQGPDYTVLYTGRLMGYARIPDSQVLNAKTQSDTPNAVAQKFLTLFDAERKRAGAGRAITLGMGDNFAPDLLARTATYAAPGPDGPALAGKCLAQAAERIPKDWMYFDGQRWVCWEQPGEEHPVDYDNVAQFFIKAGYDALVPGKHDFYFGPARLQELANYLEKGNVAMLAANLLIGTNRAASFANAYPRVPDAFAHPPFNTNFGPASLDLPEKILPWKQRFLVRGAKKATGESTIDEQESYICREAGPRTNSKPWEIALPNAPGARCSKLKTGGAGKLATEATFMFAERGAHLSAGLNHLFCTHLKGHKAKEWTCQPFSVEQPFFRDQAQPYKLICRTAAERCTAVFGVVNPELLSSVGMLNAAWLNKNGAYDTSIAVAAPDYSLQQALEWCDADERCHGASKVLMAQMPPAQAAALIGAFRKEFDVVISQTDADQQTGDVAVRKSRLDGETEQDFRPRLTLTPPDPTGILEGKITFQPEVSRAEIRGPGSAGGAWELDHKLVAQGRIEFPQTPCTAEKNCSSLEELSKKAIQEAASFPDLVLAAMRKAARTDIAFLQKRDFFDAGQISVKIPPEALQNQIDRVLWKGDFVTTLHVTGATLKKLYKQSEKLERLEHDALSPELERGRELLMLGLLRDATDENAYYVNGIRVEDLALYTVAATDYIAAGDTGYADLATPDVPPPLRVEDYDKLRTISGVVCEAVRKAAGFNTARCNTDVLRSDYFDPSLDKPADDTPGFDTGEHYTSILSRLTHRPAGYASGIERSVQQRPYLQLNLENLDFAFSGTFINHVSTVGATFAGVSSPAVAQTGSSSYGADHRLRLVYDFGAGTLYGLSDSALLWSTVSGTAPPSISQNTLGWEAGGTIRFPPKRPYWLSMQYSVRYDGEMINPAPVQILPSSGLGTTANPFLNVPAPKTGTLYGRAGLRIEHADTYVEAGFEEADFRNVLSKYSFGNLYCEPIAGKHFGCGTDGALNSVQDNVAINLEPSVFAYGVASPQIFKSAFQDSGVYLNFNLKFPLHNQRDKAGVDRTFYFILTNRGDWFFNSRSDTTVQTHYLDRLSPAFSLPIYGRLKLTPRVDIILYENKVSQNHYRAVEPSATLSYSFKWRPGMGFGRSSGYGAIATQPPGSIPVQ